VQDCDRIIVLDKGHVIEEGSHEELIQNNGFYKKIYDIQVSIEDEINEDIDNAKVKRQLNTVKSEKSKVKNSLKTIA